LCREIRATADILQCRARLPRIRALIGAIDVKSGDPADTTLTPCFTVAGGKHKSIRGNELRHYEIVFLVHPDQSEQVNAMIDRYRSMIESSGGAIHRLEDWGRRQLAYPINKIHKAHYVLMNVECDSPTLDELTSAFRFNDAVIRNLVMKREQADVEPSPMAKAKEEQDAREVENSERRERNAAERAESKIEASPAGNEDGSEAVVETTDDATTSNSPASDAETSDDVTSDATTADDATTTAGDATTASDASTDGTDDAPELEKTTANDAEVVAKDD